MIIDIHTHAFPDDIAPRAVSGLSERAHVPNTTDGTCAGLLASMEHAGIDLSVIMPVATKPSQVSAINTWAVNTTFERLGIICFGTLHPDMDDCKSEIKELVQHEVLGVKMHPDYQGFFVDDPQVFPLYKAIADAGLILMLHAGIDIGLPFPTHCTPERLAKVLKEIPGLTIIAAHMGGYRQWDAVDRFLVGHKIYFDTSFSFKDMGPKRMVEMIRLHGAHRILFGSDCPWTNQAEQVAAIQELHITNAEKQDILYDNAKRLLNL